MAAVAMELDTTSVVCPGDRLQLARQYKSGSGTCVKDAHIVASVVGVVRISPPIADDADKREVVEVVRVGSQTATIPTVGDVVLARVRQVNARLASTDIMCLGSKALDQSFSGVIRQQDVRATEIDKVQLYSSFRPGDIVRAEVLSLGDARSYYLTTAKNELGVVFAKGPADEAMVPISWQEMQCPVTKTVEQRKVAKA